MTDDAGTWNPPPTGAWFAAFDPDDTRDTAPPLTPWRQAGPDGEVEFDIELGPVLLIGQADEPGGPVTAWRLAERGPSS